MRTLATASEQPLIRSLGATLVFAALTAALAQVTLPWRPVPVTLQVLGVALSGLVLGSRLGALAQLEYVAAGLAGAPVFAGWSGGPACLLGPTGGYIPGFILGAFVTGLIFEMGRKQDVFRAFFAGMAGVAAVYVCGAPWLAIWFWAGGASSPVLLAWRYGVAPFIGVDTLKVTIAAMMVSGVLSRSRRIGWKR